MPYAKSVPSKAGVHGARPDPGDLFDCESMVTMFLIFKITLLLVWYQNLGSFIPRTLLLYGSNFGGSFWAV